MLWLSAEAFRKFRVKHSVYCIGDIEEINIVIDGRSYRRCGTSSSSGWVDSIGIGGKIGICCRNTSGGCKTVSEVAVNGNGGRFGSISIGSKVVRVGTDKISSLNGCGSNIVTGSVSGKVGTSVAGFGESCGVVVKSRRSGRSCVGGASSKIGGRTSGVGCRTNCSGFGHSSVRIIKAANGVIVIGKTDGDPRSVIGGFNGCGGRVESSRLSFIEKS